VNPNAERLCRDAGVTTNRSGIISLHLRPRRAGDDFPLKNAENAARLHRGLNLL
jgi:hypothetical protein